MKKVLIVDDSKFIYEEMKIMLENSRYEVAGYAESGEKALEEYESIQPDVVTMDIILPGIDGFETTKKIIERWPMAKVVMVSSLAYDDTIQEAEQLGAREFLYKPFEAQALLGALDKACES